MGKFKELTGDIMERIRGDSGYDAFCCTTNTVVSNNGLVMGKGVALAFKQQFPDLPNIWGKRVSKFCPANKTYVLINSVHVLGVEKTVVYFPTKFDWKLSSPIELVRRSAQQLQIIIEALGWTYVLLPRPGCNNGGLSWQYDVGPVLEKIFDERVTIINKE